MRILAFNWHTPYNSMLAMLGHHHFEIAPPNIDSDMLVNWDETMRPIPPNVTPISKEMALDRLRLTNHYDLVLGHNVKDIVASHPFNLPKILVFHNKLSTEAALGKNPDIADKYREQVKALTQNVHLVFISENKRADWKMEGDIIMPGIDISLYGGYSGDIRQALRVGNSIKVRDLMTGYSVQEKTLAGLPNILIGENPDIPGCKVSKGWEDLKQAYRENRLLLNTTMPPWEDGYNLSTLEAMATGMPVVSTANPTCPITNGEDGFTGENDEELRRAVIKLLDDRDLAAEIGAAGQKLAARNFSMDAFLGKWDTAITRAADNFSKLRTKAAAPQIQRRDKKHGRLKTGKKNVIVCYTSYPPTTGHFIERAFRLKHNVVTAGGKIAPSVIERWNLHNLKDEAKTHDIPYDDLTADAADVMNRLPKDFEPDLFFWIETGLGRPPENLDSLDIPAAAYLIDTHLHTEKHIRTASMFDVTFLAQRTYISKFNEAGLDNIFWMPLGCDPEIHGKNDLGKSFDVGFVGSLGDERRVELLQKLAEKMEVRYDRVFMREMADFFCRSRIVFNNAILGDLNMRVFEALCSGSMLLTDDADGLGDFFEDREHLAVYHDGDVAEIARHYIDNESERERIAEAGRKLALEKHTYAHRVDAIVEKLEEVIGS